ncbi:MAG: methylmalonyl-CoA mutase family protein [Deltaproteobacteria bacterium]|nr:methylmalonyl-CoA mutase family protein [Deltaproteobacteria bacterium]
MSKDSYEKVQKEWETGLLAKALGKAPERRKSFETTSGLELERLYLPEHLDDWTFEDKLGFPGAFPFTRGVQPTMYRGRFWTMRQYAGFASARETNSRFRYLLEKGQTGLSVAFDLPTQMGYDPDHPLAEGEVGKVGVSISTLDDMRQLFDRIPLSKVSTSMTINSTAAILLAMYVAVAQEQGADITRLRGTIQNDLLKEYVARGTYIFPPRPSMRIITNLFEWCKNNVPRWNPISISGYHIREAGSTAVQEIAFTLANGIAYVQAALDAGLEIDQFAGRLSFFFAAHSQLLEEIAKFRAARRLWAKIMRNKFKAANPKSWALRFHTQTCGHLLTAQQPQNNIVRVTLQALAAVLGGTQSLHTNSWDEAFALPTEDSVRIALRTQQILAYESGVADTVDPLAGSYAIEKLTDDIEQAAWILIQEIEDMGGAVAAVENGWMSDQIADSAYKTQKRIDSKDLAVVGVNKFVEGEAPPKDILRIDPALGEKRKHDVIDARKKRDEQAVVDIRTRIAEAAAGNENLFPFILDAVKKGATLGEISNSLREVFGEYKASA